MAYQSYNIDKVRKWEKNKYISWKKAATLNGSQLDKVLQ